MKNLRFLLFDVIIAFSFIACTPAGDYFTKPNMIADNLTIKVGQITIITMSALTKVVTGGDPNLTQIDTGFIYSPRPNQSPNESPAPYFYKGSNLEPGSEPTLFPIDPDLEVVLPVTGSDNVPPAVATVRVNDQSKVMFTIKGKSVGTAVIRGGFLNTTVEAHDHYDRTPLYPAYDGEITIQIIP